jgi:YVTN family beta-propeller protein
MKIKNLFYQVQARWQRATSAFVVLIGFALIASACTGNQVPAAAYGAGIPNTGGTAAAAPTTQPTAEPAMQEEATPTAEPAMQPETAPKAYLGLFKDNAVAVLDTATNRVLTTIPVPAGPHGLVVTQDGRWVYVSSDGDSKVSVIDTSTDQVVKSIEVGQSPHGLAITPDGSLVLVADFGTSQVVFINTTNNQVIGQVSVASPHNIAISPDGQTAYVAAQKQGLTGLAIINIDTRTVEGNVPLDKTPRALNYSPDGKLLYFTLAGVDAVQALDPATNQVATQIPVGASPHHPLFTPDGETALVVSQGPGSLSVIDVKTATVQDVLTVGKMPHWIAVNSQGTTAWVTNEASNDVSVVDLRTDKVIATIPVGNAPRKIVVQPRAFATGQTNPPDQAGTEISINGMAFSNPSLTIKAGQTVTWTNNDPVAHTVTSDQGLWDSGEFNRGESFSFTFKMPGQYSYHCTIHPFMTGTIIVTQ